MHFCDILGSHSGVYLFFKRERQIVFFLELDIWTLECYIVNKEKFQNNLETVDVPLVRNSNIKLCLMVYLVAAWSVVYLTSCNLDANFNYRYRHAVFRNRSDVILIFITRNPICFQGFLSFSCYFGALWMRQKYPISSWKPVSASQRFVWALVLTGEINEEKRNQLVLVVKWFIYWIRVISPLIAPNIFKTCLKYMQTNVKQENLVYQQSW